MIPFTPVSSTGQALSGPVSPLILSVSKGVSGAGWAPMAPLLLDARVRGHDDAPPTVIPAPERESREAKGGGTPQVGPRG